MNCAAIHRHSKDGRYWANASHFLFCSEAHGHPFYFKNLYEDLAKDSYHANKLVTAFSKSMKNELLRVFIFQLFKL